MWVSLNISQSFILNKVGWKRTSWIISTKVRQFFLNRKKEPKVYPPGKPLLEWNSMWVFPWDNQMSRTFFHRTRKYITVLVITKHSLCFYMFNYNKRSSIFNTSITTKSRTIISVYNILLNVLRKLFWIT